MGKEGILEKRISRRDFLKKSLLAAAGIGLGAYAVNSIFSSQRTGLSSTFKDSAPEILWKWSKEGYHYIKLGNNVRCNVCNNNCILENNERGICRVRINKGGKLYSLVYGNPCSVHVDPIEKKPLFHFLPGTASFSIATAGCNFRCLNCQNWQISQSRPEDTQNTELFPEDVVRTALSERCSSVAYTYSEPTVFYEYMYDTSKIARNAGIKNVWVTNGYMTAEALSDLSQYLDAAHVDLKGFREDIYNKLNSGRLQPVLDTMKLLKEKNVWFEVVNLVIPTYTDDMDMIREMCAWIVKNIGPNYPLHLSRFQPLYKLKSLPPTPVETLENARKIAIDSGIKFSYIGNVPGHTAENTYCPRCAKILIERSGYQIKQNNIENGSCKYCGENIPGVWKI
jgi:pyruvate formate lyase activating enzyme